MSKKNSISSIKYAIDDCMSIYNQRSLLNQEAYQYREGYREYHKFIAECLQELLELRKELKKAKTEINQNSGIESWPDWKKGSLKSPSPKHRKIEERMFKKTKG